MTEPTGQILSAESLLHRRRGVTLWLAAACAAALGCSNAELGGPAGSRERTRGSSEPKAASSSDVPSGDFPVIELGPNRSLRVDGVLAGDTTEMVERRELRKVDELYYLMKQKREDWKTRRPDTSFPGVAGVRVEPGALGVELKSVMQTAAYAGYPRLTLQVVGAPEMHDVWMQVPRPPFEDYEDPTAMHVTPKDDAYLIEWKIGSTVAQTFDVAQLETGLCEAWADTAGKPRNFESVVHFANDAVVTDIVKILGALERCKPKPLKIVLAIR